MTQTPAQSLLLRNVGIALMLTATILMVWGLWFL
jgi:hypothetical protein